MNICLNVFVLQYLLAFFSFFTVVFGGLLVGIVVGAFTAYIVKHTRHTRVIEPLIIFTMSYLVSFPETPAQK